MTESAFPHENENPTNGLSKHELGALMIAQGLVAKYNLKSPEDQKTIARLSYELSAEILYQFK
jgi:hypothetical protein